MAPSSESFRVFIPPLVRPKNLSFAKAASIEVDRLFRDYLTVNYRLSNLWDFQESTVAPKSMIQVLME